MKNKSALPVLTVDDVIDLLRAMPDGMKQHMDMFGVGVVTRITLMRRTADGDQIRLVCGVEFVDDDEDAP